jgi:hypothetical protein
MPSAVISNPLLRRLIIGAGVALIVGLGGCSMLRLSYGQADAFAYRWIDGYTDLDGPQSVRVRERLRGWFDWNRRTQLVDYAELLGRIDAEAAGDVTAERVCGWWAEVHRRIGRGLEQALPGAAELATSLRPMQIEHMERRYAKANQEYRDEFLQRDPAKRRKETLKRTVSRAETVYGTVDESQRKRLAGWVADSPFDPALAWDERQWRQRELLQLLRGFAADPPAQEQSRAAIRGYLQKVERSPREAYRSYSERLRDHNCRMVADLHNHATPQQRQHASKRLKGWIEDLRALAGDVGS